jgi:DtxR family Mn-dependent transcriptional regulator
MTGVLISGMMLWMLWPRKGLLASFQRLRLNSQRVQLEDALKFLFDCEYKSKLCGLNSIAGNLSISTDQAARLLDRLRAMGLVQMKKDLTFHLTDDGRSYALRVIRVHRIWERYLADETSLREHEWHSEADLREHYLSVEAADQLAAQLGNPVFDPHGDPIPTPEGEIPEHRGQALHTLKEGQLALILHLEDEPRSVFDQLIALGLHPGMQVYVLDVSDSKITFAAEGKECVLTPLFASSVTVELLKDEQPQTVEHSLLSSLSLGQSAEVLGIARSCRGAQRRRLMDLGVVPGTLITAGIRSASGDPVGYRILGATVALRKDQADQIFISEPKMQTNESHS